MDSTLYIYTGIFPGEEGRYLYSVASGYNIGNPPNYEQKCEDWFFSQFDMVYQTASTLSCPCDRRLAMYDRRWQKDRHQAQSGSQMTCYYQRHLRFTTATQVYISCLKIYIQQMYIIASYQHRININISANGVTLKQGSHILEIKLVMSDKYLKHAPILNNEHILSIYYQKLC